MSRALQINFQAEKDKVNPSSPRIIVEINYGGAVGTKYYSELVLTTPITESDLLISIAPIANEINEDKGGSQNINIEISDTSKTILGYMRSQKIYKSFVRVWQSFVGVDWTEALILWVGTIRNVTRKEQTESVIFSCETYQTDKEKKIGTNITETTAKKEGEILPVVYGKVKRSKCVQIIESKRTTLVIPLTAVGSTAIVSDSSEFTQDTNIWLYIGNELVFGKFSGCLLTLVQRNAIKATGYTTFLQPNQLTFRANLTPSGYSWLGCVIRFYKNDGSWFERTITNYTSPDIYGIDSIATIPANMYYEISDVLASHGVGEEVYEALSEYKWVLNDGVSTSIDYIEILGSVSMQGQNTSSKLKELETYIRLDENYYTINLNDGGKTTLSMAFDPRNLKNKPYKNTDLLATFTGINYTNAIEIIVDLAQKFGLVYPTNFDTTTEASVKTLVDWLKLGFAIKEKLVFEVIFDIAFQSRIGIIFDNEKMKFFYLENKAGASIFTFYNTNRLFDSFEISETEVTANKLEVTYGVEETFENVKDIKKFEILDATSISSYGEKTKSIKLWAIQEKNYANAIAYFWLRRWAYPLEKVNVSTFLTSIELQPNDWVTLDSLGNFSSQPGQVTKVSQNPSGNEIDKIDYEIRLPRWAGCSSSCEQYEQTGCSSSCEQYCTSTAETSCGSYACETQNQTACSLTCVVTCELECTTFRQMQGSTCSGKCETGCTSKCQNSCTSSGCESSSCTGSSCTVGCQTGCTTGEQSQCLSSCEIACEVACETGGQVCSGQCESSCQLGCTTGAETSCSDYCEISGCQGACTTGGCTVSCQAGCTTGQEACSLSCRACCEGACTSSCEQYFTVTCSESCTADIQLISWTSCSQECEISCQVFCEGFCQECCQAEGTETTYECLTQCQTGCIQSCETTVQTLEIGNGCSTACQGYCMTSVQSGCSLYCTLGCVCECQLSCEGDSCTTSSETSCMCQCQTAVEQSCSTSNEACFLSCQAWCESGETTGCAVACQGFCMLSEQILFCSSGCQCECTAGCEVIGCTTSSETSCMCQCQTVAESSCNTSNEACYSSCRAFCETSAQTGIGCTLSCQAFAQTSTWDGCYYYCTVGCMCQCTLDCQGSCRTGVETNCDCFCMTATAIIYDGDTLTTCLSTCRTAKEHAGYAPYMLCITSCRALCTTSCRSYCETAGTTGACNTQCQTFSQNNIWEGCSFYCTIGCMCLCTTDCQVNCRSGSETSCMCLCMTAGQV